MVIEVPEGSLYFWCYTQGLKHIPLDDIYAAVRAAGKDLRPKDVKNYWNGWYRSDLYGGGDSVWIVRSRTYEKPGLLPLTAYPEMPWQYMDNLVEERWVPCNRDNKPMVKWGQGCMSLVDASSWPNQVYLAENNRGCSRIIIDCDGDHGDKLDLETILFLARYMPKTHTLYKDRMVTDYPGYENSGISEPASFHLSFLVHRIIPTMHFPKAGIDIIGNKENTLRYLKTKSWNGRLPVRLDEGTWDEIRSYIELRERR